MFGKADLSMYITASGALTHIHSSSLLHFYYIAIVSFDIFFLLICVLSSPSQDGATPLSRASHEGHVEIVRKLLESGVRHMPDKVKP